MRRLSEATYAAGPRPERVGILHLGLGAFHRAHQAVFTEDAGAAEWGICGVTQRSATVADQLRPQDCLYSVLERGRDAVDCRVVGVVRDVLFAEAEPERLRQRFSDPAVRIVSLTVTEKGYTKDAAVVDRLVRGLDARRRGSGAPVTVLCCDNLTANGRTLRRLVQQHCAALPPADGEALAEWIASNVRFPSTMVDRIVPATTAEDRAEVAARLGLADEAAVVAEPFRQWVIEDDFAAGRPEWERAGAQFTGDVGRFETMKLRLLNGTHSLLAYLGALRGHDTIAQAVADPDIAEAARGLLERDALPTLAVPEGVDAPGYVADVLERFANPALRHRTTQVAMDGSQKLPLRLLGTIRDRLAAGRTPVYAARAVAAWMVYVAVGRDRDGRPLPLEDPLADRLRAAAGSAGERAAGKAIVDGLLAVREVFGGDFAELADHAELRAVLEEQVRELLPGRP
ncbi:mannitol dehydrogenase family protein [Prauserella muralis]|uniref:Mannitol-1-phosphate 5-dehydrogenase n=1 Tax=Prauserella muralis TaxID=588067 RepID=A0A2V4AQ06_9PSEU|nr:mannitol dehydrogenase family protein [Prauserella muralis]PXY22568.1 mannitol dehydrogenase [Prauserella muralis]TWE28260.1 fructuronate reductase [Prauserella muralis]